MYLLLDANGIPIGFIAAVEFKKVKTLSHPSWLSTLIAGKYEGKSLKKTRSLQKMVHGAMLINIADDPDLKDATGGYNFGCYIKGLNNKKENIWLDAGLDKDWVIQKINEHEIFKISD